MPYTDIYIRKQPFPSQNLKKGKNTWNFEIWTDRPLIATQIAYKNSQKKK